MSYAERQQSSTKSTLQQFFLCQPNQKKNRRKNREFAAHGYAMIRFTNEETVNETLFLNKLYYELLKIDDLKNRRDGMKIIRGIEDILYAQEEEECLVDESELSYYGMSIRTGSV